MHRVHFYPESFDGVQSLRVRLCVFVRKDDAAGWG